METPIVLSRTIAPQVNSLDPHIPRKTTFMLRKSTFCRGVGLKDMLNIPVWMKFHTKVVDDCTFKFT